MLSLFVSTPSSSFPWNCFTNYSQNHCCLCLVLPSNRRSMISSTDALETDNRAKYEWPSHDKKWTARRTSMLAQPTYTQGTRTISPPCGLTTKHDISSPARVWISTSPRLPGSSESTINVKSHIPNSRLPPSSSFVPYLSPNSFPNLVSSLVIFSRTAKK